MALFKVYYGDKSDLPKEIKDSFSYIYVNEEENLGQWEDTDGNKQTYGLGEWFVDAGEKRYRIASARLVDDEGNIYSLNDLLLKTELTSELQANAAAARNALNVYAKTETYSQQQVKDNFETVAYYKTLFANLWTKENEDDEWYKQTVSAAGIKCGKDGKVPPFVTWADLDTRESYQKIDHAEASVEDQNVTFYTEKIPEEDINIIISDYR